MFEARTRISHGFFRELECIAPHRFNPGTSRNLVSLGALDRKTTSSRLASARGRFNTLTEVMRFLPGEIQNSDPRRLWTACLAAELHAQGELTGPGDDLNFSQARRTVKRMKDYFQASPQVDTPTSQFDSQDVMAKIAEGIMDAFEDLGSYPSEIKELAKGHSLSSWREERILKSAALAAPSAVGGPIALAYLPLEVAALMRFTFNAVLGVGFIRNGAAWTDDFLNTFYVMSDDKVDYDAELQRQVVTKLQLMGAVPAATIISTQAGVQILSSAIINTLAIKAGAKIAPPVMAKLSAKLAAWLSGPTLAKWIPVVGAVVSASINGWVTNTMIDGADRYYAFLRRVANEV